MLLNYNNLAVNLSFRLKLKIQKELSQDDALYRAYKNYLSLNKRSLVHPVSESKGGYPERDKAGGGPKRYFPFLAYTMRLNWKLFSLCKLHGD